MIKIVNNTKLSMKQIGEMIDIINNSDTGVTNYVGRHLSTDMSLKHRETEEELIIRVDIITQKNAMKFYFGDVTNVSNKKQNN